MLVNYRNKCSCKVGRPQISRALITRTPPKEPPIYRVTFLARLTDVRQVWQSLLLAAVNPKRHGSFERTLAKTIMESPNRILRLPLIWPTILGPLTKCVHLGLPGWRGLLQQQAMSMACSAAFKGPYIIYNTFLNNLFPLVLNPPPPNNKTSPLLHTGAIVRGFNVGELEGLVLGGGDSKGNGLPG